MKNIIVLLFHFNLLIVFGQCPTSITFETGNITALISQSESWIITTSSLESYTTVNPDSITKFDANPTSGFVELNPGFISFPINGSFVAQAFDGCGKLTPSSSYLNKNLSTLQIENIKIYPNPSKDVFNIQIDNRNALIEVFNTLGMKVYESKLKDNNLNIIDLSGKPSGTYFVKSTTNKETFFNKIVKY